MTDLAQPDFGDLLSPKEITIIDGEGREKKFFISKFPAVQGREIVAKYPVSALPKLGDYAVSEETMLKLMAFVGVMAGPTIVRLGTRLAINNHVGDWEALAKIEMAMMEYNCSFFRNGTASSFLAEVVQSTLIKISKMWIQSSGQSSPKDVQP